VHRETGPGDGSGVYPIGQVSGIGRYGYSEEAAPSASFMVEGINIQGSLPRTPREPQTQYASHIGRGIAPMAEIENIPSAADRERAAWTLLLLPAHPQQITVHFEPPLAVRLEAK
jgi:hypothetical protein